MRKLVLLLVLGLGLGLVSCSQEGLMNDVEGFSISPNPTSDFLELSSRTRLYKVEIINFVGQVVLTEIDNKGVLRVDVSMVSVGYYLIRVYSRDSDGVDTISELTFSKI